MIEQQTSRAVAVDYLPDDEDSDGWYGYQLGYDGPTDDADDASWDERADTDRWYLPPEVAEQADAPTPEPVVNDGPWERRLPGISTSDFQAPSHRRWFRSQRVGVGFAGAALTAALVAVVLTATRSPEPTSGETSGSPQPSSSAAPAPGTGSPLPSTAVTPPPSPPQAPPPPPLSAEQITTPPPVARQQQGSGASRQEPSTQRKPEMNVTRAPMSAGAPSPPPSQRDSSAPGDSKPRRRGFW